MLPTRVAFREKPLGRLFPQANFIIVDGEGTRGGGGGEYMKDHIFELRIKDMKTRLDIQLN